MVDQLQPLPQAPTQVAVPTPSIAQPVPPVVTPPLPPADQPDAKKSDDAWLNPLLIILGLFIVIIAGILLWIFVWDKNHSVQKVVTQIITREVTPTPLPARTASTIAGTISFQGYVPPEAYLVIVERELDDKEFKSVITGLVPQSGSIPWTWDDATTGINYEIKAQLKVRGSTVQESAITQVSAPGNNVELTLISEQDPPAPQNATITGSVHLDGYLPSGSTLVISSSPTGSNNAAAIISILSAQDGAPWSWSNALVGTTYDLTVQLKNAAGNPISTPVTKTITAPSSNLLFSVSSTAQPPAPAVTGISGSVTVNGSIPANSYITLGVRTTGGSSFNQVGGNISASNGTTWSWNNAITGTEYDVQAYLWVNGKPFAASNIPSITGPSVNNVLTINAQQAMAAPTSQSINVSCNGQQSGQFQATVNYNTDSNIQNAQKYRLVVTLASQGNQVINTVVTPGNPNQPQTMTTGYQFTSGATYYAQYAYSKNGNDFSALSPSIQFACQ